jgi:hypothetical protein
MRSSIIVAVNRVAICVSGFHTSASPLPPAV